MNERELLTKLIGKSREEMLWESTRKLLSGLSLELEDAAYRCIILRWFNPTVLDGVLGAGHLTWQDLESADTSKRDPTWLCEQLQSLPFVEEYAGRGHNFHDLTREVVLHYLWLEEREFYREVCAKAAEYFDRTIQSHEHIEWDMVVELAYHLLIADEEQAIIRIDGELGDLAAQGEFGQYDALIQVVEEHTSANRVSTDIPILIQLWRLKGAFSRYEFSKAEEIARAIIEATDEFVTPGCKADATSYLAEIYRLKSRFDEAEHYFQQNLRQFEELESVDGVVNALLGLGGIAYEREKYESAGDFYLTALELKVSELIIPAAEDAELPDSIPLRVFDPYAWTRQEIIPEKEEVETELLPSGNGSEVEIDEASELTVFYFITVEADTDLPQAANEEDAELVLPAWPVAYDASLANIWLKIGYLYQAMEKYDTAAACGRLALQIFMDLDDIYGAQDAVAFVKGIGAIATDFDYVQASLDFLQEALNIAQERNDRRAVLNALLNLASHFIDSANYENARDKYEEAMKLAESMNSINEQAIAIEGLARIDWIECDYGSAEDKFHQALNLHKQQSYREGEGNTLMALGDFKLERDLIDEAVEHYEDALDILRDLRFVRGKFACLLGLAKFELRRDNLDKAFEYLTRARKLSQQTKLASLEAIALSELARHHLLLAHQDRAREHYEKALMLCKQIGQLQLVVDILSDQAQSLTDIAEYGRAVDVLNQAIELDNTKDYLFASKGWALEQLGRSAAQEAKEAYETAIKLNPEDIWLHKGLANALRLAGDTEAAATQYQLVVDQIEKRGAKQSELSTLGWCHYQLGNYKEAERQYKATLQNDPTCISDYFDLGLVCLCLGKNTEATGAYQQGIDRLKDLYPERSRRGFIFVALDDLAEAGEMHPELANQGEFITARQLLSDLWDAI